MRVEKGVLLSSLPLLELQVGCFTARGVDEGVERGVTLLSAPPRTTGDPFLLQGVLVRVEKGVLLSSLPLLNCRWVVSQQGVLMTVEKRVLLPAGQLECWPLQRD